MNMRKRYHCSWIIIFFMSSVLLLTGCNMNGVRTLSIVNEIGNQLTDVLIIPLYQKSFVIAFGPDGKGFQSETRVVITRLFVFNSGENLLPKKLESKGLSLGPVYWK